MRPFIFILFLRLASTSFADPSELRLPGDPPVHLIMDREYRVTEIGNKDHPSMKDLRVYLLRSKDDQSSAVLAFGSGGQSKTEETIAAVFGGAKVTKIDGIVAGEKTQWWHYRESDDLLSSCVVTLRDKKGKSIPTYFDLVAKTPERLAALEDSCSKIEFR
jgi:hypothetical protein